MMAGLLGDYDGVGAGLLGFARNNAAGLIGFGSGMLSAPTMAAGFANAGQGFLQGNRQDMIMQERRNEQAEKERQTQAMSQWLATQNLTPQQRSMAQANPEIAQSLFTSSLAPKKRDLREVGGALYDVDAGKVVFQAPKGETQLPTEIQEYNMALQQGFKGGLLDYQQAKKGSQADKVPSGFRWKNNVPNGELEPIPGGPGEQMPAELSARIGLTNDVLKKMPELKQAAKEGKLTGVVDNAMGQYGQGEAGKWHREAMAGAEALTRMLTGAGMNMAEAQREAQMYLPTKWDNAESAANKLEQLERRLISVQEQAMRGRGGAGAPSSTASDPLGIR